MYAGGQVGAQLCQFISTIYEHQFIAHILLTHNVPLYYDGVVKKCVLVQVDVVLLGHFAHIKYGIAHAAQRGVDAQSGKVDNLLET